MDSTADSHFSFELNSAVESEVVLYDVLDKTIMIRIHFMEVSLSHLVWRKDDKY